MNFFASAFGRRPEPPQIVTMEGPPLKRRRISADEEITAEKWVFPMEVMVKIAGFYLEDHTIPNKAYKVMLVNPTGTINDDYHDRVKEFVWHVDSRGCTNLFNNDLVQASRQLRFEVIYKYLRKSVFEIVHGGGRGIAGFAQILRNFRNMYDGAMPGLQVIIFTYPVAFLDSDNFPNAGRSTLQSALHFSDGSIHRARMSVCVQQLGGVA